jgi:hypothetical protein
VALHKAQFSPLSGAQRVLTNGASPNRDSKIVKAPYMMTKRRTVENKPKLAPKVGITAYRLTG